MTHAHDDETTRRGVDLNEAIRVVRTYWMGIAAVALLCLAAAATWTILQPRVYTSNASGVVQAGGGSDAGMALAAESLAKSKALTFIELAGSQAVASAAAEILADDSAASELLDGIELSVPDDSTIIQVEATGDTPQRAHDVAAAWIQALSDEVDALENPEGSISSSTVRFVALSDATTPSAPSSPDVVAALAVGALVGLIGGSLYAVVRQHLDARIRSAEAVERTAGVPVLGKIVDLAVLGDERTIVSTLAPADDAGRTRHFAATEGLRELRTNLSYVSVDDPPRAVVVVSASPGEGKSTITANLADAVAAAGTRSVIVDCDLRKPVQAAIFGLEGSVGVTDVLSGRTDWRSVTQSVYGRPLLSLIAAGRRPPNPSELLDSQAMRSLVRSLVDDGAFVFLDAPPLLSVADAAILSTVADGVILTVDASSARQDRLQQAVANLNKVGARVLGVVVNKVPERGPDASRYGYYSQTKYYGSPEVVPLPLAPPPSSGGGAPDATAGGPVRAVPVRRRRRNTDESEPRTSVRRSDAG